MVDFSKIESFLSNNKKIVGKNEWKDNNVHQSYEINVALQFDNGEYANMFIYQMTRKKNTCNNENEPNASIILQYEDHYITRLNFNPCRTHKNPVEKLRKLNIDIEDIEYKLPKNITRYYPYKYKKIELQNSFNGKENIAIRKEDLTTLKDCINFFKLKIK